MEFKFTPDVDTAFMELQAGTIDILKYLTTAQAQSLSSEYNLVEGSMNLVHGMYLNSGYEPLSNAKVRQLSVMPWTGMQSIISCLAERAVSSGPT